MHVGRTFSVGGGPVEVEEVMQAARSGRRGVRRRWVVLGSAVVLAGAGVAVLLTGVPTSEPLPWVSGWVSSQDSRTLMVRAVALDSPAGQCGPPEARFTVRESSTEVRVAGRGVRLVGGVPFVNGLPYFGATGCTSVGYGPTSHAVTLAQPLGDRRVVDDTTGQAKEVLDAASATTIRDLPHRLVTTDLAIDDTTIPTVTRRSWTSTGPGVQEFVSLETASGPLNRLAGGETVDVDGTHVLFADVIGGKRDVYYLEWQLPSGDSATASIRLRSGVWSREQALDIIDQVREATP
jgi:hypothetical protein